MTANPEDIYAELRQDAEVIRHDRAQANRGGRFVATVRAVRRAIAVYQGMRRAR